MSGNISLKLGVKFAASLNMSMCVYIPYMFKNNQIMVDIRSVLDV